MATRQLVRLLSLAPLASPKRLITGGFVRGDYDMEGEIRLAVREQLVDASTTQLCYYPKQILTLVIMFMLY